VFRLAGAQFNRSREKGIQIGTQFKVPLLQNPRPKALLGYSPPITQHRNDFYYIYVACNTTSALRDYILLLSFFFFIHKTYNIIL